MNLIDPNIENILKKAPQFTRFKRHASTLFHHSTPRKLINLIAVELQRKMHRTRVSGYPYFLIVEPGNICNLRCPMCPTGLKLKGRDKKLFKFEDFRGIIDRLHAYAYEVSLHNWGEPFLNRDILKMIRYCDDKNIGTNLSTNLNIVNLDVEGVVTSGLEYLVVSLDGTTQDVYSQYRVGGKLDLALQNLINLIKKKKDLRSKTPFIEWQFIVMKHNYHQIDHAKEMAKEMGADIIRFIPPGLPFAVKNKKELAKEWFPYIPTDDAEEYIQDRFLQKPIRGACFYLYRSVTVNPTGAVSPCCVVWEEKDDFGNMIETDFSAIWNNELYRSARALFSKKEKSTIKTACHHCNLFAKA